MIQQAVRIQENGFIGTVNTALDTATDTEVTPMEIDYMNKKQGNPLCGCCFESHQAIDCKQHHTHKLVHTTDAISQHESHLVDLTNTTQVDTIVANPSILAVGTSYLSRPTILIRYKQYTVLALWDTGSALTCIDEEVAKLLGLPIDTVKTIIYSDVNQTNNRSVVITSITLFGQVIQ
ncbi:hypothetical protein BD560DRAFT_428096 [Blakeslea trispora]|nr:hypothetical protein BD560DRAFT_428096 [Blakeslea trispora]